jgi:cytochrome c peroxidase
LSSDIDAGRGELGFFRSSCADLGKFKTPTLSNVELSAPHMHNGKYAALGKAVSHFEDLARGTLNPVVGKLDQRVKKGAIKFGTGGGTPEDMKNMVEFLKSLTGTQLKSPAAGVALPVLK